MTTLEAKAGKETTFQRCQVEPTMNITPVIQTILLSLLCAIVLLVPASTFAQEEKITFADHAKPIFKQRCARCHNPNKKSGGLDLTNFTNMMQGGSSGSSIEPGDASGSYLFMLVTHEDEPAMPPGNNKIPENEIKLLADWINGGALETTNSVARITKPKIDLAVGENPNVRPEVAPLPPRLSKEPVIHTARPSNATTIATSPWAPIAAIGMARQVLLYDTTNLNLIGVLPFPEGTVHHLRFSRTGTVLISGGGKDGASGVVVGWDVRSGERAFSVGDELDTVLAADISTDHTRIALGGPSRTVKVYSTEDGEMLYEITKHTDWVTALQFSPDGQFLATGDRNGGLHVWDSDTGEEYLTLKGHTEQVTSVSWRVDGKIVASSSEDDTTRVWETENGKQIKSWVAHNQGVSDVVFTREGKIVTSGRDRLVKLWKQDGKEIRKFTGLGDIAIACGYCNESNRVIGSDWAGTVRVWNPTDGKQVGEIATNPAPLAKRIQQARAKVQSTRIELGKVRESLKPIKLKQNNQMTRISQRSEAIRLSEEGLASLSTALNFTEEELQTIRSNQANKQDESTAQTRALQLLRESLQSSTKAAEQLPEDEDLKAAVRECREKITELENQIATKNRTGQLAERQIAELEAKRTRVNSEIETRSIELERLKTDLIKIETAKQALQPRLDQQTRELAVAQARHRQANEQLARWESEQQFAVELEALYGQLKIAEGEFVQAAEKTAESKSALEKAQADQDNVSGKLEAIQAKIRDARKSQQ